jgi:hypothetical protein
VDPRAGLDAVEKRKNLASAENRTLAVQPIAIPTELSEGGGNGLISLRMNAEFFYS